MKYLLMGAAAIALLTACGKKDETVDAAGQEISQAVTPGKLPKVSLRAGDAATAGEALTTFALDDGNDGLIKYENSKIKGDSATFTDVTLIEVNGEDGPLKVGKLTFDGLGMFDGEANFSRMLLSDVNLSSDDTKGNGVGSISSIELINPSPELAAWVGAVFASGEPGDLSPEHISFDQLSINDVNFKIDEPDGETGTFVIDGVELIGVSNQNIAGVTLKSLALDMINPKSNTNVKASLANFEVRGLNLALLSQAAGANPMLGNSPKILSGLKGGSRQDDPANPGYDTIRLDDLDMKVAGAEIKMAKFTSDVKRDKKGRTVKISVAPYKASVNVSDGELGEKLGTQLARLGFESLEFEGQSEQKYDPDSDVMTLVKGKNYYQLADGFRLDLSGKYEGTKALAAIAEEASGDDIDTSQVLEKLDSVVLHNITIALDDDGIVDRAFSAYAAQSGQDPEELRAQISGMMAMAPMMAGGSGVDTALVTEAASALASFITDPKTLTITLNPKEPLAASILEDMSDPSSLTKELLGFSASNE